MRRSRTSLYELTETAEERVNSPPRAQPRVRDHALGVNVELSGGHAPVPIRSIVGAVTGFQKCAEMWSGSLSRLYRDARGFLYCRRVPPTPPPPPPPPPLHEVVEVVGGQLYKRIADLETEVHRLKPFERKPWKVPGRWLFVAFALGVAALWIAIAVSDARSDRRGSHWRDD